MASSDKPGGSGIFGDDESDLDAELDKWTEEFDKFKLPDDKKRAAEKRATPTPPPSALPPASKRPATPSPLDVGEFLEPGDEEQAASSSIKPLGEMLGTDDDLLGRGYTEVFQSVKPPPARPTTIDEAEEEFRKVPTRPQDPKPPALAPPKQERRSSPAIIRREELQARREGRTPTPPPRSTPTPPSSPPPPPRSAFPPARTVPGPPPPRPPARHLEAQMEVDESFYDDIVVAAAPEEEEEQVQRPPTPVPSSPRMVTRNVVRRATSVSPDAPLPKEVRVARPITPPPVDDDSFDAPFPVADRATPIGRALGAGPLDPAELEPIDDAPIPVRHPPLEFDSSDLSILEVIETDEEVVEPDDEPLLPLESSSVAEPSFEPIEEPATLPPPAAPPRLTGPPPPPGRKTAKQFGVATASDVVEDFDTVVHTPPPKLELVEPSKPIPAPGQAAGLDIDPARFRFPEDVQESGLVDDAPALLELYKKEIAVTRDRPQLARLHVEAGRAAERAGDLEGAREHYDEAHQADRTNLSAARAMRRLLVRQGSLKGALPFLEVEVSLASPAERPALAAYRADLLVAIGEQDLARVAYGEILDAKPEDVRSLLAQLELAFADERWGELADSLARLGDCIADRPLAHAAWLLRGRLLERAGNDAEAKAAFERARAAMPGSRLPFLGLARLAARTGNFAEIAACEGKIAEGTDDPSLLAGVWRRRAWDLEHAGDLNAACAVLEEAHQAQPDDPLVLENLAGALERAGRTPAAIVAYEHWAKVDPARTRRAEILRRAAGLHGANGDPAQAAWALRRAAEEDPGDPSAAAEQVAAYLAAGDVDAAVAVHRAVAEQDGEDGLYDRIQAARLLAKAGRVDDAIAELEQARAAGVEAHPLADELARLYAARGRDAELAQLLSDAADSELERRDPGAARLRAARAADRAVRRHLDEGIAPHADMSVDEALEERTRLIQAADLAWRRVLDGDPDSALAHVALVRLAMKVDEPVRLLGALAEAQASARDIGRSADFALRRSAVLLDVKEGLPMGSGAEEALGEVLDRDSAEPRSCAAAVALAAQGGRWNDVVRLLLGRAQKLKEAGSAGCEADALAYRAAATLVEREQDFSRAVEVLRPIADGRPGFLGAQMLLESAYRRLGDAASLAVLAQNESTDDGTPAALRFARLVRLAETLEGQVGDAARAVGVYQRALLLRPGDPLARDGFTHAAVAAAELTPLSDMALSELKRAEESGDVAAKVAAYAELARIDGDLRGDQAIAAISWSEVAELDPTHGQALRALERYYTTEMRHAELAAVWAKIQTTLQEPNDVLAAAVQRGHLLDLVGDRPLERAAYESALAAAGTELAASAPLRMALFRLETRAREHADDLELARLDDAVAVFYKNDPRGQASFMTRAGEAFADLGRPDEAIARFKAAHTALPGHSPALRGWQRTAMAHQRWGDVVEACEREAEAAKQDGERARLYHLAALAAMDHDLDGMRAAENLRRVLSLDPRHEDAFLRLRMLLDEQGKYEDLAHLLSLRVETETDTRKLVEHHHALAGLYRDFLNDRERAKAHLRAVLQRDPHNKKAIAALSDIAWEQGAWAEAAEALILRAKLESSDAVVKEIFYRLGLIYAERLPDPRWAMKSFERVLKIDPNDEGALDQVSRLAAQMGEWRLAQQATERLALVAVEPAAKVTVLHHLARIYDEGFKEPHKAEDAYRRALDTEPADPRALAAVVEFYGKRGDSRALRVQLDRLAGLMRLRLARDSFDGVAYRVLARALQARAQAGSIGSIDAARCAAEAAHALGAGEETDVQLAAETLRHVPFTGGLADPQVDEQLFHHAIPSGFRQVFRLMHDTLGKRFPADLRRWGVGRGDKLPRSGHPIRDIAGSIAEGLRVKEFDLYVSTAQPNTLAVEQTDPISLVLGSAFANPDKPPQVRFALGRLFKLAQTHMAVPARLNPEELGILLAGVIRQFDPGFAPPALAPVQIAEEQQRLSRLIPKRLRDEILPFATELTGSVFDHRAFWEGVHHTGNRAGLLCSGSVLAGLVVLLRLGNHKDIASARGDHYVEDLLRFAVSEEHCELRKALAG